MQQQQLHHVSHTLTQTQQLLQQATYSSNNSNNKHNDEEDDDVVDTDGDDDDDEMDTTDMDYTSRALAAGGNLNILHLKDAKDVTQAVRLLTRQVGELHRLRRDVSQLQLSRRQQHRRQTALGGGNGSSSHERLANAGGLGGGGNFQECGCQPGEFLNSLFRFLLFVFYILFMQITFNNCCRILFH